MTHSNDVAIAETIALARELGIDSMPVVLADRSNLVLLLEPHRIVARVAMATSMVRVGMAWLRREVEISVFLDARGAFVTRPCVSFDAGPYLQSGFVISFWELERANDGLEPLPTGQRLAQAHRELRHFPNESVPEWGAWIEARAVLARARSTFSPAEDARVMAAFEEGERIVKSAPSRSASIQPVHGDAHIRNVLTTSRGPVWTDWEDAFVGPVEWDLACLRSRADLLVKSAMPSTRPTPPTTRRSMSTSCAIWDWCETSK